VVRSFADRRVVAVFWKKLTRTDAGPLLDIPPPSGTGAGAKHLPIHADTDIPGLLGHPARSGGTEDQPEYSIVVESPGGDEHTITIRYNVRGSGGGRREWMIVRQNAEEQHPVWKPGEKLPGTVDEIVGNYMFLIRLADGSIHARVATPEEVERMPQRIRDRVLAIDQDMLEL
jgi:hypothetical protein